MAMYMQRTKSGAAGNGLGTTIKYMRGAADIGLGSKIKYLRRTTSAAVNSGLSTTIKYLANITRVRITTGPRPAYTKAGNDFC
jgi:ribosome biogenesis GTPase A